MRPIRILANVLTLALLLAIPAAQLGAQSTDEPTQVRLGPETNLPLPRFVSLKTAETNVRRGPSLTHRIDWVFVRRGLPMQVIAEFGHWRRVIDQQGEGGWVHYSLLSGERTVLVMQDLLALHSRPDPDAPDVALLEAGVIAYLGSCSIDWCQLNAGGYRGWAEKTGFWGVDPGEIRE